jgi:TRAP-type C4-dicarboxylate transport system substrate-binding protein
MKGQTIRVQESPTYVAMMKAGVQINDVKDITAFQGLMKPAYDYVEGQVGKEFMTRLRAAVQAATK